MTDISIDSIVELYETWGHEHYDEELSQMEHALQCASLASAAGASDELIVAALLHDIGHLFEISHHDGPDHRTDLRHEATGSAFLGHLFPETVTVPVAMHVEAKRYLAATEPGYLDALSHGSKRSLEVQGGAFTEDESAEFLSIDRSDDAVALRRWDDHGKVIDLEVAAFETWMPLLRRVAIVE